MWLSAAQEMDCDEGEQQNDALWYRKDANEVLIKDGPEILKHYIESAKAYPIVGLQR